MKRRNLTAAVCLALAGALTLTACGGGASGTGASGVGPIGADHPRADTDFWNSYIKYFPDKAKELGINLLNPTNSQNKVENLVANAQSLQSQGAKAIIMAPQDTGAIASTLDRLDKAKIPVVTVDTRPDKGNTYMVVRADNKAYGE